MKNLHSIAGRAISCRYSERKFKKLNKAAKKARIRLVKTIAGFRTVDLININGD